MTLLHNRTLRLQLAVTACAATLLVLAPTAARAEVSVGPHAGLNFDWEEPVIGAEARLDLSELTPTVVLQLDPAFTLAFLGGGVAMDIGVNLPFMFVIRDSIVRPYSGPGLSVVHFTGGSGGTSITDVYFNLLGGMLLDFDGVDPFAQLKVMVPHGSMVELMVGVLFRL
jgi:hypothetical protein